MLKKILFIGSVGLSLLVPFVSKADEENLYRNDEYHFRIKFPVGWEVKNGDGKNVVKKAVNSGSTVLVLVKSFYGSLSEKEKMGLSESDRKDLETLEMNDYSEKEVVEFMNEIVSSQLEAFPGSKVLEKEIGYIDNRKAIYLKMNQLYKVQNQTVEGIIIYYSTIHKGKLYQIQGSYPKGDEYQESTIRKSLATFVFEDGNESSDVSSTTKGESGDVRKTLLGSSGQKYGSFALAIMASFLFTWGLGLIVPLLLRFVFLKRPLSGRGACLVASFMWAVQFMIASGLSGKSNGHQSLILVAVVSYWILRRDALDGMRSSEVSEGKNEGSQAQYIVNGEVSKVEQVAGLGRLQCAHCGQSMKDTSLFCSQCGKRNEAIK